jgi:hypothetical protein
MFANTVGHSAAVKIIEKEKGKKKKKNRMSTLNDSYCPNVKKKIQK